MVSLASDFLKYLKPKESKKAGPVFRIITSGSVALFLTAAALTVASSYFGDPITCTYNKGSGSALSDDYVKNYCWIHGTSLIEESRKHAFPCAAGYIPDGKDDIEYNPDLSYYQWTSLILVLQAGIFYIPKLFWQYNEKGLAKEFTASGSSGSTLNVDREKINEQTDGFVKYFLDNMKQNNSLFLAYVACEFATILSVIVNFLIINSILLGKFVDYGSKAWNYYNQHEKDVQKPMCEVFPTVVSCDIGNIGVSGAHETNNALCILNQNTVNEKTFIVVYFWYIFLFIIGIGLILARILSLAVPAVRAQLICFKVKRSGPMQDHVRMILSKCDIGDWFLLHHISNNVDAHFFTEFLYKLAKKMNAGDDVELTGFVAQN